MFKEKYYLCPIKLQQVMNVKKTIASIFLLFVTMFMVAHSAVVHHHSGDHLHAIVEHFDSNNECTKSACEHEHAAGNNCCSNDNCSLGEFFRITQMHDFAKQNINFVTLFFENNAVPQIISSTLLHSGETPFASSFYRTLKLSSVGLRAPPAC